VTADIIATAVQNTSLLLSGVHRLLWDRIVAASPLGIILHRTCAEIGIEPENIPATMRTIRAAWASTGADPKWLLSGRVTVFGTTWTIVAIDPDPRNYPKPEIEICAGIHTRIEADPHCPPPPSPVPEPSG